jgi:hypothetical protein
MPRICSVPLPFAAFGYRNNTGESNAFQIIVQSTQRGFDPNADR